MNTFHLLNGQTVKTERFMQGPTLTKDCHWKSKGHKEWVETKGAIETVDPNKRELFGYDEDEFLAKQYR